ncbi:MAG TPA: hypothetical protein HA348_00300 [Thermoplasmata archaeon]|nr:hypothetical protein [Thermoplasmata archaeon]
MKVKKKVTIILIIVLLVGMGFAGIFAYAYIEESKIGILDEEKVKEYKWKEVEVHNLRNNGVGYAISTYMPSDGRPGNLKIMTYSYPSPKGLLGDTTRTLALDTAVWNAKSYDMTFTNIEKEVANIRGEKADIIYIDFITNTSVPSVKIAGMKIDLGMNIRSHGKFIIALFSPSDASVIRDCFIITVSYCLIEHEIYLRDFRLTETPADHSTYDEMKELIFDHISLTGTIEIGQ